MTEEVVEVRVTGTVGNDGTKGEGPLLLCDYKYLTIMVRITSHFSVSGQTRKFGEGGNGEFLEYTYA